jgi:hypothetical protein
MNLSVLSCSVPFMLNIVMMTVANKPFMLSVFILNVIMLYVVRLNVVAHIYVVFYLHQKRFFMGLDYVVA